MKPPKFAYHRAAHLEDALEALRREDARVIAGGQSLMPMLNFRLLRPALLVDVNRIAGLDAIEATPGGGLRIGALARHQRVAASPLVRERFPVLAAAVAQIGHLAIRNRGTIGGSLSHADPAAEHLLMSVLLEATLSVRSKDAAREVAAREHISGALSTTLAPDEMLTAVTLPPLAAGTGWGFEEVARRRGDFAIVAAGVLIERSGDRVARARIAVAGDANGPRRMPAAEAALAGSRCEAAALGAAVAAMREAIEPNADLHASPALRRRILGALLARACTAAWTRASETRT